MYLTAVRKRHGFADIAGVTWSPGEYVIQSPLKTCDEVWQQRGLGPGRGRPCRGQAVGGGWPSPHHGKNLSSDAEELGGSSSIP